MVQARCQGPPTLPSCTAHTHAPAETTAFSNLARWFAAAARCISRGDDAAPSQSHRGRGGWCCLRAAPCAITQIDLTPPPALAWRRRVILECAGLKGLKKKSSLGKPNTLRSQTALNQYSETALQFVLEKWASSMTLLWSLLSTWDGVGSLVVAEERSDAGFDPSLSLSPVSWSRAESSPWPNLVSMLLP